MRGFASITATALLSVMVLGSPAVAYPDRPVTVIVPWPAGGSTDIAVRALADVAAKHLGQPIIVENKAGASGTLGPAAMAATAKPDGYTVAQMPVTVQRLPMMQKTSWDAKRDFTYIIHLTGYTFGIITRADGPFKQWSDVVAYAKANPGKVTYGTPGAGTSLHIGMEQIAAKDGIQLTQVPFKGAAEFDGCRRRRPYHAVSGGNRLATAGRSRDTARPDDLDRGAQPELSGRADAQRPRVSLRLRLALGHRRSQRHGPGAREKVA